MFKLLKIIISFLPSILAELSRAKDSRTRQERRTEEYRANFYQVQNMMTQNTIETDKALMTFAIAALAALAAFNDKIFGPYGLLSFITIASYVGVIIIVTVGYTISNTILTEAQKKLTQNYSKSVDTPLNQDMDTIKFGRLGKILNHSALSVFIVATILFLILLMLYIQGVK